MRLVFGPPPSLFWTLMPKSDTQGLDVTTGWSKFSLDHLNCTYSPTPEAAQPLFCLHLSLSRPTEDSPIAWLTMDLSHRKEGWRISKLLSRYCLGKRVE